MNYTYRRILAPWMEVLDEATAQSTHDHMLNEFVIDNTGDDRTRAIHSPHLYHTSSPMLSATSRSTR